MTKNSNKKYTNITLDKFTQNLLKIIPAKKEQEGVKKMEGNQPIYKVKVGGIEVAVWSNHGKNNGGFETVTMHRTYKDKNNNWQKHKHSEQATYQRPYSHYKKPTKKL